jgi:hypothetical protein
MKLRHLFFLLFCLCACSGHRDERELGGVPVEFSGQFQAIPGEKLKFKAKMGLVGLGELSTLVSPTTEMVRGHKCFLVTADASSASGLSWISKVVHHWESWIDSASGVSIFMRRQARENRYTTSLELSYFPDSSKIVERNLKRGEVKTFSSSAERMNDMVNLMWKLRNTNFNQYQKGDTLRYSGFHDGEWLSFRVCYAGITELKWNKSRQKVFELYPVGLETTFLRGENPARIWIETASQRRPLKVKLETYFGNFLVDLIPED